MDMKQYMLLMDFIHFAIPWLLMVAVCMVLIVAVLWLAEKWADFVEGVYKTLTAPKRSKY